MSVSEVVRVGTRTVNPSDLRPGAVSDWTRITPRHLQMIKSIPAIVCDRVEIYGRVQISNTALELAMNSLGSGDIVHVRKDGRAISKVCDIRVAMDEIDQHLQNGGLASVKIDRLMDGTGSDLMSVDNRVSLTFALATADRKLVASYDIPLNIMFVE